MDNRIKNDTQKSSDSISLSKKELLQELLEAKLEIKRLKASSGEQSKTFEKHISSEIEEEINIYKEMFHSSPNLKAILIGPDFIVKSANNALLRSIGKTREELLGKPYLSVIPELEEQGIGDLFREVYRTGIPYRADEKPIYLNINDQRLLNY